MGPRDQGSWHRSAGLMLAPDEGTMCDHSPGGRAGAGARRDQVVLELFLLGVRRHGRSAQRRQIAHSRNVALLGRPVCCSRPASSR
jgi:hypothetical protein